MKAKLVKRIEEPLFKSTIMFVANHTFSGLTNEMREFYGGDYKVFEYGEKVNFFYVPGTTGRVVMTTDLQEQNVAFWFWASEPEGQGDSDMGWLAHECLHIVAEILRNVGVKFSGDSEEVYSYLIEWIMKELVGIIWSHEQSEELEKQAQSNKVV